MERTSLLKLVVLGFSMSLWAVGCGRADRETVHVLGNHDSGIESPTTIDGSTGDETVTPTDPGSSGGSTTGGTTGGPVATDGSAPHYLPPPAIAPEIGTPPVAPEPYTCRAAEPLDNFPGINHCIEGYCQNTLTDTRLDCPYGRPEGVAPLPDGVTCRAWTPLEGHAGIFHCIEGTCVDAVHNTPLDCPYGVPGAPISTGPAVVSVNPAITEFRPMAHPLSDTGRELLSMCREMNLFEHRCGSERADYCRRTDEGLIETFVAICGRSDMTATECIDQINRANSDIFAEEGIDPCVSSLYVVADKTATVAPAPMPLQQAAPKTAALCGFTTAQSRLICTVSHQCGDVSGEDVLRCWDRGALTLSAAEVDAYQSLATDRSTGRRRTPGELILADSCLENFCRDLF